MLLTIVAANLVQLASLFTEFEFRASGVPDKDIYLSYKSGLGKRDLQAKLNCNSTVVPLNARGVERIYFEVYLKGKRVNIGKNAKQSWAEFTNKYEIR